MSAAPMRPVWPICLTRRIHLIPDALIKCMVGNANRWWGASMVGCGQPTTWWLPHHVFALPTMYFIEVSGTCIRYHVAMFVPSLELVGTLFQSSVDAVWIRCEADPGCSA